MRNTFGTAGLGGRILRGDVGRLSDQHRAVGEHYDGPARNYELTRLDRESPVERAIMERYLTRFVPEKTVIADIGVGGGHYDEFLARRGCCLHLADVSDGLLHATLDRLNGQGLSDQVLSAAVASATDLGHLADACSDAVLMLGPLYHLLTLEERQQAVREARRIVSPSGVFMAAACNRMIGLASAYWLDLESSVEWRDAYLGFLDDGIVDPESAPTIGHAHFSTVAEFRALFQDDFKELLFVGIESLTSTRQELFLDLSIEVQEAWLDLVEAAGSRPEGIAMSEHLLFVGQPRQL